MLKKGQEEIWEKVLVRLEERVGKGSFELWFKPLKLIELKEESALIEAPNRFFREWIEDNYLTHIQEVLFEVANFSGQLKFRLADKDKEVKKEFTQLENRTKRLASKGIFLNPRYTFESFVVGPSNQFANAAAKTVAEQPGSVYNPLFIYGGVGLGKTHLINAIGNFIVDNVSGLSVLYVPIEQFTNEVVAAIRHQKMAELKEKYRNVDVLLVDDIQFISGKVVVQEELFHTFNHLYDKQKQIVMASDRPPKEIQDIPDRLKTRFSMGLIADIQPPEYETRIAILNKKAEKEKIKLPEEVCHWLAKKIKSNIRELEGCLIKLAAHSSLTGTPINLDMAKTVLKDVISDEDRPVTPELIQKIVAEAFGLKVQDLKVKRRTKEIAIPRQVGMYIARELTQLSLSDIGKHFGGKDHSTVIYACRQIEEKMAKDENFRNQVKSLIERIKP
jgi:chromosomal replication initiator protein